MSAITVLLAEDHLIVRDALRALLKLESDIEVIGEAVNGRQVVDMAASLHPDVIVMDIAMPQLNGMEAARQILMEWPATKILILSSHSDDDYVSLVMAIGASGYLTKQTAVHLLPKAIRLVHEGMTFFSPSISLRFDHQQQIIPPEMEVLQLMADDKAHQEVDEHLHISGKHRVILENPHACIGSLPLSVVS